MSEFMLFALAPFAGMALGAVFFGGLWWSTLRGLSARQPALWFGASMLARTGIALAGFYFVAGGDWRRLLLCVAGFTVARVIVLKLTRVVKLTGVVRPTDLNSAKEDCHAP